MQPLFWTKVTGSALSKTVWSELPSTLPDVRFDELDGLFALDSAKPAAQKPQESEAKKTGPTTLIEHSRAHTIGILLVRIKLTSSQIRQSLLSIDDERLTLDNLKALKTCSPTSDELEIIREFAGDVATLSRADQYFKTILGIPRLSERLACMLFYRQFELELEELKPELKILREAVNEVSTCDKLKRILQVSDKQKCLASLRNRLTQLDHLEIILVVGNVLNASTFRGAAAGFQLKDLLKLKDTKPTPPSKGTPTLLHYIVRLLNQTDKSLVGFLDDCAHVEAAARVSTQTLSAAVNTLVTSHKNVEHEIEVLEKSKVSPAGDRFLVVMKRFYADSQSQVKALRAADSTITKDVHKLISYFGEDPTQTKAEDFFGLLASFGQMMMRAEVEVLEFDRKAEALAKANAKKEQRPGFFRQILAPEVRGPLAAVQMAEPEQTNTAATRPAIAAPAPLHVRVETAQATLRAEEEDKFDSEADITPTASRFRSIGAASTLGRGSRIMRRGPPLLGEALSPTEDDAPKRSYGRGRGHFDEALKELRSGAWSRTEQPVDSGRKSLRRADTQRERRPLSRVFLDGT